MKTASKNGFTIVELLVTMGIVAIISVAGTSSFINIRNKSLIDKNASQIVSTMREVSGRSKSQKDGLKWGIRFTNVTSGIDYYQIWGGSSFDQNNVTSRISLDSAVTFTTPENGTSTDVIFAKATGVPEGTNTVALSIAGGKFTDTITVDTNGKIDRTSNY